MLTIVRSRVIDEELVAGLRVGVLRLARRLQLERAADDITLTQLSVLAILHRDGPLTIGELAAAERIKPPSMTRTVNCLEEAGLVKRCAHATDGRQVVVKLTDEARAVMRENRRRRDMWLADHLGDLDDDERAVLRRAVPLLDRLAQDRQEATAEP
jgi:DNA-binding MarR family transcriptional regulator